MPKAPIKHANKGDNDCNLECLKTTKKGNSEYPQTLDFKGPIRVVVVDPPEDTGGGSRRTAAAFIGLANMLIAANTIIVILFTFTFCIDKSLSYHVFFTTLGYLFCLPLSILMVHPLFGPARPMDVSNRIWAHVKMLILAVVFMGAGIHFGKKYAVKPSTFIVMKYHRLSGIAATVLLALSIVMVILLGVFKLVLGQHLERSIFCLPSLKSMLANGHRYLGLLSVVVANVSFIMGMVAPRLQLILFIHGSFTPMIAIISLTLLYTLIMIIFPGWRYAD